MYFHIYIFPILCLPLKYLFVPLNIFIAMKFPGYLTNTMKSQLLMYSLLHFFLSGSSVVIFFKVSAMDWKCLNRDLLPQKV